MKKTKVTIKGWLTDNYKKFDDDNILIETCVKTFKSNPRYVKETLGTIRKKYKIAKRVNSSEPTKGISLKDFKKEYDLALKLKKVLSKIPKDRLLTEAELKREMNIDNSRFRKVANLEEFESNFLIVKKSGKQMTYWGHPDAIQKAEEVLNKFW